MELRQLRYFITVAQTLNFSEAARRLYITQGTLSQQIQQLEFELGSQLFERSSRNVSLTEAGEELLPLALETTAASEACMTRMNDLKGALAGTLRLGSTPSFKRLMTDAVNSFVREQNGVSLSLQFGTEEELMEMLRNKEIDLAVAYKTAAEDERIETETLMATNLQVLMRNDHPFASRSSIALSDLVGRPIIIPGKGMQARRSLDRFVGIDTRKLNVKVETNDPYVAIDLARSSNLLTIITPIPLSDKSFMTMVPLELGQYRMNCCVHRLKAGYRKKSADIFLEMLRDSAQFERFAGNLQK